MTTGLTYSQYKTAIAEMAVIPEDDANFLSILPQAITYAENRIYRDLDLLETTSTLVRQLTANNRQLTAPSGSFVVTEQLNVITPSTQADPNSGTRNPLLPATKEFLDAVYGAPSYTGMPIYFAPFTDNSWIVGPFPDASYYVEIVGTVRPASLSATNTTTFLSLYFPDIMIMATMIYISAFQRNFGRQSDDPQMAQSYEGQYRALLDGASKEEARKKFEAAAWSSQAQTTQASPSR
jgi:hypothetical protein